MSKFVHMELSTSDSEAAQKFYKSVFGWKYQKMKMDDGTVYTGFTGDGQGIGGGIMKSPDPNVPPHWIGYVGVDSVKRTVAKVEKNGGKVLVPRMEVPNIGFFAIISDPQGATFGVWESVMPAEAPAEPEAAQQVAPAEAAPKAKKKSAKKAGGKKAAEAEAVPAKAGKKAGKKSAKKQAAEPEAAPAPAAKKKAAKKKTGKKA